MSAEHASRVTGRRSPFSRSLHVLLSEAIDYAGLFPPASLSMTDAVREYAAVRLAEDAWALGRFVVAAARLDEFATVLTEWATPNGGAWRLSALVGADPDEDVARVRAHNTRDAARSVVECVEAKAATAEAVPKLSAFVSEGLETYVEVPLAGDLDSVLSAVHHIGARAKLRMGGATAEAFPLPADILRFLQGCLYAGVSFKATAGLHHPIRAGYRLTYAPDSPMATMFGFLNVLLAAAFLRQGAPVDLVVGVLTEQSVGAFRFGDDGVMWRDHGLGLDALALARRDFVRGMGSCSFREPLDELVALRVH